MHPPFFMPSDRKNFPKKMKSFLKKFFIFCPICQDKQKHDKSIYRIATTVCTSTQDYLSLCILTKISYEKTFYFSLRFPDAIHQLHGGLFNLKKTNTFSSYLK